MTSHSGYCLPGSILWMSVIISSALVGSMVPEARNLPLVVYFMSITVFYHSGLLVSSLTSDLNMGRYIKSSPYMDPLDTSHMFYTLCLGVFWLLNFVLQINSLKKGPREDRQYFLGLFSCIEWMLNALIIYLSVMAWGDRQVRRFQDENDLEYTLSHVDLSGDEDEVTIVYMSMGALPPSTLEPIHVPPELLSSLPMYASSIPEAQKNDELFKKNTENYENV